jgi:hypothetical protein
MTKKDRRPVAELQRLTDARESQVPWRKWGPQWADGPRRLQRIGRCVKERLFGPGCQPQPRRQRRINNYLVVDMLERGKNIGVAERRGVRA